MIRYIKKNTLLKVLSLNSISVAVSFVLGIISSKVVAYFLGTPGMAMMGSFRNFATMLKSMAQLGVSNSVVKLFVENKEDEKELSTIYSTFFWIFLIISSFLGAVVLIFAPQISSFLFFKNGYVIPIRFFALALPFVVINSFWMAIYNGLERFKRIIVIQIISNILLFITTTYLIYQKQILGGLLSLGLGEFIMVLVTFLFVQKDKEYFQFKLQKVIQRKYINIIKKFSIMALLSAVIAPMSLLLVRNFIVHDNSIEIAGIWDGVNRLSGFYMLFFSTGLSLYYMPKLASLTTDEAFMVELKYYFKLLVPLFTIMIIAIYLLRELLIKVAFTKDFESMNSILIWQLGGDLLRIMTLAFGFQILMKTMMKKYFLIEIVFNLSYVILAYFLVQRHSAEGALQAYFYANLITFLLILFLFRKQLIRK